MSKTDEFAFARVVEHDPCEGFGRRWSVYAGDIRLRGHCTKIGAETFKAALNFAHSASIAKEREKTRVLEEYLKGFLWAHSPGSYNGDGCSRCDGVREVLAAEKELADVRDAFKTKAEAYNMLRESYDEIRERAEEAEAKLDAIRESAYKMQELILKLTAAISTPPAVGEGE